LLARIIRRRPRLRGWTFAASALGDLDFDLREAAIDRPKTTVTVLALAGSIGVYVPEGVSVDVSGLAVFGHIREWGRDVARAGRPGRSCSRARLCRDGRRMASAARHARERL
jgi:hypothetical protein